MYKLLVVKPVREIYDQNKILYSKSWDDYHPLLTHNIEETIRKHLFNFFYFNILTFEPDRENDDG
jgi:hypothetical protein